MTATLNGNSGIHSDLTRLPGKLPVCEIPDGTDLAAVAEAILAKLPDMPAEFFTEDALLRDQLSLSETFRTIYGGATARATWLEMCKRKQPSNFKAIPKSEFIQQMADGVAWITGPFTFETALPIPAAHSGFLNIVPGPSGPDSWQVWSLQTCMENYVGHEMVDLRRAYPDPKRDIVPKSTEGLAINRFLAAPPSEFAEKWAAAKAKNQASSGPRYCDAIILGGGQHGLCAAGYSRALGLDAVVVEKNDNVGDNWVLRYDSLYLHTPQRFNDLAFGPTFNEEEYGEWLTAADLAKGYKYYAKRYDLDIWLSSNVTSCTFEESKKEWTMHLTQKGVERVIVAPNLLLSMGAGGSVPLIPKYKGQDKFKGTILHSSTWKSAVPWKGKKGIVVGTANTGHDVAENMLDAGLSSITMLQRTMTYVIPRDFMTGFLNYAWLPHDQRSADISDRMFWSPSTMAMRDMCFNFFNPQYDASPEWYEALERVGFSVDTRGDFMDHLLVRFGGHFMDHGASAKIAAGKIKVKGKAIIDSFTATGLKFTDGSELDADLVVLATGFEKDMTVSAGRIVGDKIANQLEPFFGIDAEGEASGAFRHPGFPNIWLTGGGCAHARYFTRLIALQMLATKLGHPVQPYKDTVKV